MADVSRHSGRPLTFAFFQFPHLPEQYREIMRLAAAANARRRQRPAPEHGAGHRHPLRRPHPQPLRPQPVLEGHARPAGGREAGRLRRPRPAGPCWSPRPRPTARFAADLERHYLLEGPDPDYRPDPARSLPALAAARGVTLAEAYMDLMVGVRRLGLPQPPAAQPGLRRGRGDAEPIRWSCWAWPTPAPTSSRSWTPASPPGSSPTGCATAGVFGLERRHPAADLRHRAALRDRRPGRAAPGCGRTSTSSTSTGCASPCPRSSTTSPATPAG